MNRCLLLTLFMLLFPITLSAQYGGKWAFMSGYSFPSGNAYSAGTAQWLALNKPPCLCEPLKLVGSRGTMYMYGNSGFGLNNTGMWQYDPYINEWRLFETFSFPKSSGVMGVPVALNGHGIRTRCFTVYIDACTPGFTHC